MSHFNSRSFSLGRRPNAYDLVTMFSFPDTVTMIYPLKRSGRQAVFAIAYEPTFSVHPIAVFGRQGEYIRFPTTDLIPCSRSKLPYEIKAATPLRTAADPRNLAISWAERYLDEDERRRI